jgi:hypothetical protein
MESLFSFRKKRMKKYSLIGKGLAVNIRRTLFGIVVLILILLPAFSMPAIAEPNTKLYVAIIGGIPGYIDLTTVQGAIVNVGDNPAYNISYTFSITGGYNGNINSTLSDNYSEMSPGSGLTTDDYAYGFGPVIITFTVSASNADTVTRIVKGFQIGKRTLVPFSLIRYLIYVLVSVINSNEKR